MSENSQIEQFLILAKNQKAKALETIIEQVLSHPNIFVFGEFLSLQNITDLGKDNKHWKTLSLFAFDSYLTYKASPSGFIDLKPQQLKKLKMITITELASRSKELNYKVLMSELNIKDLRELEDMIIDCIYNDLLKGQLDQKNQTLQVEYTYGRDSRLEDVDIMLQKLEEWDKQLKYSQELIERQIKGCNISIKNNFEKQVSQELETRKKKDDILKAISEGKSEIGGIQLDKRGSRKDEMGGSGGGMGSIGQNFLSGMKRGFFK